MFDWWHDHPLEPAGSAPEPARGAPSGACNPYRQRWAARLAAVSLLTASLGLLLFLGWVIHRGASDLIPGGSGADRAASCGTTRCLIGAENAEPHLREPVPADQRGTRR